MLTIDLLDLTGQWRPFSFAASPAPVSTDAGTGRARWAEHWEAMARKRQAMQEDEELIALLTG